MAGSPGVKGKLQDDSGIAQTPSLSTVGVIVAAPSSAFKGIPKYVSGGSEELINLYGSAKAGYEGFVAAKLIADTTSCWVYNVPSTETGTLTSASVTLKSSVATDLVKVTSKAKGTKYNAYSILVTSSGIGTFSMNLLDEDGDIVESFQDISFDKYSLSYIGNIISEYLTFEDLTDGALTSVVVAGEFPLAGGTDLVITVSDADYIAGINALNDLDTYGCGSIVVPCNSHKPAILSALASALAEDGATEGIVCPPEHVYEAQDVVAWTNGEYTDGLVSYPENSINNSQIAVYAPWGKVYDTDLEDYVWISGEPEVIKSKVFTSDNYQPWFAPAGPIRGKVDRFIDLKTMYDEGKRDLLYGGTNIVNPIAKLGSAGFLIYGQKTSLRNITQQLTRVNVRTLQNYIYRTIMPASLEYVFEPNDEFTWGNWILMASTFMKSLKDARGVYDYKVIMAPTDTEIDQFKMLGIIKYKPTKAAEFSEITFNLKSKSSEL